jgi:hypothetical protein
MAVTSALYGKAFVSLLNKEIDIDTDSLKVMLCTSGYTPDQDAHQYKSDVTNEVTGTGYTAGGVALTGVTVTYTAGTNVIKVAGSNPSWSSSTITARYAVLYDSSPASDATRPLLAFQNFGADVSTISGTFQITWNASGIFTITVGVEA